MAAERGHASMHAAQEKKAMEEEGNEEPEGSEEQAAKTTDEQTEARREAMQSLEESLPVFLRTAWDMSAMDVSSTAAGVCEKLTKDISVPWQIRYRRAIALQQLGRIFLDASQAGCEVDGTGSAKESIEQALFGSLKKGGNKKGDKGDRSPRPQ